jgi:hypothetical protein
LAPFCGLPTYVVESSIFEKKVFLKTITLPFLCVGGGKESGERIRIEVNFFRHFCLKGISMPKTAAAAVAADADVPCSG